MSSKSASDSIYESILGIAEEDFQFTETIRIGGETKVLKRYSVGDFDFLPEQLDVDEDRCKKDEQYREAMDYLWQECSVISRTLFNDDKKYRNAINLLAGNEVAPEPQGPRRVYKIKCKKGLIKGITISKVPKAVSK